MEGKKLGFSHSTLAEIGKKNDIKTEKETSFEVNQGRKRKKESVLTNNQGSTHQWKRYRREKEED